MVNPNSLDIFDEQFESEVIEHSRTQPVVADFWAPWCAPCRQLAPLLDRLVEEYAGAFRLARINTEEALTTAREMRVQGIPLVIGFKGGKAVTEFQGLQPEPVVRQLITRILPSPADERVAEGDQFSDAGNAEVAGDRYRDALELERNHAAALYGLARLAVAAGDPTAAEGWLDRGLPEDELVARYEQLRAEIRMSGSGAAGADSLDSLRARAGTEGASTSDILAYCKALAAAGEYDASIERLLSIVAAGAEREREQARQAVVDVFALLPPGDERIGHYRRELAKVLFR